MQPLIVLHEAWIYVICSVICLIVLVVVGVFLAPIMTTSWVKLIFQQYGLPFGESVRDPNKMIYSGLSIIIFAASAYFGHLEITFVWLGIMAASDVVLAPNAFVDVGAKDQVRRLPSQVQASILAAELATLALVTFITAGTAVLFSKLIVFM